MTNERREAHPLADLVEDLREARWLVATATRSMRERYAVALEAEGSPRLAQGIRADADRLDSAWARIDCALTHIAQEQTQPRHRA